MSRQPEYMHDIQRGWSTLPPDDLERCFREKLDEIARDSGIGTPQYAAYANELGTLYRVTARYAQSEEYFTKALESMDLQGIKGDRYATCLDNLAESYRLQGRLDDCERVLAQADVLFDNQQSNEYAACLNYQGHAKMMRGDFTLAARLYERALLITQKNQTGTVDVATAFQNVANAYQQMGELDAASNYLRWALDVYDGHGLRVNAHYIGLLNSLASIAYEQGDAETAASLFERAISSTAQCKISPFDKIVVLLNAGTVFHGIGQKERARQLSEQIEALAADAGLLDNANVQRALTTSASWNG